MINTLANALTSYGHPATVRDDVIFASGWGIFCSITGIVSARMLNDNDVSFTMGKMSDGVEALALAFHNKTSAL